jgi:negative regulator of flagellin synthesis FlgM
MKIGQLDNPAVAATVNERKPGAGAAPAAAAAGGEASAKVALSATAAQLAAKGSDGVFDADKVARLSESIRNGSFTVNPEAIADKLIANAQELLGSVPRN